jgi:hypothetical protein
MVLAHDFFKALRSVFSSDDLIGGHGDQHAWGCCFRQDRSGFIWTG